MSTESKTLRDISTKLGTKESALRDCLYTTLLEVVTQKETGLLRHSKVLDIGCGRGELLRLLKEAGHEPLGIDVEPDCVEISRQFADTRIGGFDDLNALFPRHEFGVVVCSHVLEHVDHPLQCLRQARQLNADRYVFSVPNLHRSIRLLRAVGSSSRADHPTHVYGWGRPEFKALLNRGGFELIGWHCDRVTVNPFGGRLGTSLTKCLGPLETWLLPKLFPVLASSLIAECRPTQQRAPDAAT